MKGKRTNGMKAKKCSVCGEKPGSLDKLWPYRYGEYICSSCSVVESIHNSGDAYDYDEHERWGDGKSYNH